VRHTWIPGRFAVQVAAKSGVAGYDMAAFFYEWAAYRELFRRNSQTIYHTLYGDESYRYLGQFPFLGKHRIVATYHQPPSFLGTVIQDLSYLRSLHALIVVSRNQIPFFSGAVDHHRLFWVPHGVDTAVFTPRLDSAGIAVQNRNCLFVGMHKRDFETLRRVIQIVSQEEPRVQFQVVTARSNEHLFVGQQNVKVYSGVTEAELVALYQNAALLLQPLLDCTANNAILEAMSCGLPAVVTDVGGVRDYVNEDCALLTPLQDAHEMATATLSLLAGDSRRAQMAIQARSRALRFDWEVVNADMRRVYEAIL
jgi:glycosyltransferase involved in cell wall biosynthesis